MEKEDFLTQMKKIPYWIETKNDALKFAKHQEYQLVQKEFMIKLIVEKLKDALSIEFLNEILMESEQEASILDEWYTNMQVEKQ